MRADAESSCTASCTDSWSQDGARNPWSAPTTELWAPTGAPLRRLIAEPHRDPPLARGVTSFLGAHPQESLIRPERPEDYSRYFAAVEVEIPADPATSAVIVASDGAWEPLWQIIHAANYACGCRKLGRGR